MTTSARFPPPVLPGDRVGVAALSGPVDPERLERGMAALARLGFEPVAAENLAAKTQLFAGSDAERLDAFHGLAADPTVKAIVFARGGHGVMRLLDRLDWDLLARHPRVYMGYSDLTPFLLGVVERLGLVAWHGPMVAADLARGLSPAEEEAFVAALAGRVAAPIGLDGWLLRPGSARGRLVGGCLSLLVSTLGTPWAPRLDDAVLFWEDVDEPLYRIDRMLTHLHLSGSLARIRGMVIGHCRPRGGAPRGSSWPEPLAEPLGGYGFPVAFGVAAGHEPPNLALPLGLAVRLDDRAGTLVPDAV